jgi:hypothetical protein
MAREYKYEEGSGHDGFQRSRAKIQLLAGGYGGGKTTDAAIKGIMLGRDYPGSNGLIARTTYPKLNDTIRKEVLLWTPAKWVKKFTLDDNVLRLVNGTTINFRYVQQTGKGGDHQSSNLLSANYDWIVFDQADDPEFTHKDFLDLLGRLRGSTAYNPPDGVYDPTMPATGPRWIIITANPTRNWLYKELVEPVHVFKRTGIKKSNLLVNKLGEPLVDLFEVTTYDNPNLPQDYIEGLEATYQGAMRDRYLLGKWEGFDGLVYPQFDLLQHVLPHQQIMDYLAEMRHNQIHVEWQEGYDHGIASQSAHLLSFSDQYGNVFVIDGFYQKELHPYEAANKIRGLRYAYHIQHGDVNSYADPSIFRRSGTVGPTVNGQFEERNIMFRRGANDIAGGIAKIQSYLNIQKLRRHPITRNHGAPLLFISDNVPFLVEEFGDYYWKRDTRTGESLDIPRDGKDHALDALKYLMTARPRLSNVNLIPQRSRGIPMTWGEMDYTNRNNDDRAWRHANG